MLPDMAIHDQRNKGFRNLKAGRDGRLIFANAFRSPDCQHCFFSQTVIPSLFPSLELALFCFVPCVFKASCQKEMVWIYASWIVAARAIVADLKTLRNWSLKQLPSYTVRPDYFPVDTKSPVVVFFDASPPDPTALSFLNKTKKAIRDRAVMTWKMFFVPKNAVENSAATATFDLHLKTFLSDVLGAAGYSRWLPFPKVSQ